MGDPAAQLLSKIWELLEKKEKCAKHFRKLVKDLEDLNEYWKCGKCIGSSLSVVGAGCMLAASAAILFTGGAAIPLLGSLGAAYVGTGTVISLTSQAVQGVVCGSTMEDARKAANESEAIEKDIKDLMERLKRERVNTDQAESDYIAMRIFEAMCRACHPHLPFRGFTELLSLSEGPIDVLSSFFTFGVGVNGKIKTQLIAVGIQKAVNAVKIGKTVGMAGGKTMAIAGGIGMAFALSDAINNWNDLIKKERVTEASQSLRDTAERIETFCKEQRSNLMMIKEAIDKAAQQPSSDKESESDANQQPNNKRRNRDKLLTDSEETTATKRVKSDSDKKSDNDEDPLEGYSLMALFNTRSMATKARDILDIIEVCHVNVFLTTETWLTPFNSAIVLEDASPFKFKFYHVARMTGRGGGVAIQHTNAYNSRPITFPFNTVFEVVAVVLENDRWEVPVLLVNVYFPPRQASFEAFASDFEKLLKAIDMHEHVIFTGDFNIHMDQMHQQMLMTE